MDTDLEFPRVQERAYAMRAMLYKPMKHNSSPPQEELSIVHKRPLKCWREVEPAAGGFFGIESIVSKRVLKPYLEVEPAAGGNFCALSPLYLPNPYNTQVYLTPRGRAPNSLKPMEKHRNRYFSLKGPFMVMCSKNLEFLCVLER